MPSECINQLYNCWINDCIILNRKFSCRHDHFLLSVHVHRKNWSIPVGFESLTAKGVIACHWLVNLEPSGTADRVCFLSASRQGRWTFLDQQLLSANSCRAYRQESHSRRFSGYSWRFLAVRKKSQPGSEMLVLTCEKYDWSWTWAW